MTTKPKAHRGPRADRPPKGGRAPKKPIDGLAPEEERKLSAHLRLKLPSSEAELLFRAILEWFTYGPRSATPEALVAREGQRRHFWEIAKLARALRKELRVEPPLWNTKGIDWTAVDELLAKVSRSAEAEAQAPERPRGAPTLTWRDDLIALVHAHYPPDKLTRSWSGHFEQTIVMLLGFLGEDVQDVDIVHTQIRRTLKRAPHSPLTVRLE